MLSTAKKASNIKESFFKTIELGKEFSGVKLTIIEKILNSILNNLVRKKSLIPRGN